MRKFIRPLLIACVALIFGAVYFVDHSAAQRRMRTFQHSTRAHKEGKYKDCASCHTLPTKNWTAPRRDKLASFPDVATYPYHTACFGCHVKDIYSNGGAFCGSCHVTPTMRAQGGRGVLPFPLKAHSMQFKSIFPHDVHQDLIASNDEMPTPPVRDYAIAHFVNASFTPRGPAADDKPPTFYNCAICHKTVDKMPKYVTRPLRTEKALAAAVADTFDRPVAPEFFKDSPTGHESCFTCHYGYKNLPEGKQSCAGCHQLTQPYFEKNATKRYSLKFDHNRSGHAEKDCTSCHLRITQQGDVNLMKDADVPIASCKSCHATQEDSPPWKQVITTEIDKRDASIEKKEAIFQCTYCHTSAVGRFETPSSHRKP